MKVVTLASAWSPWTTTSSIFIRGEGGFGGDRGPSGPRNVAPERAPDHEVVYTTLPQQALLYRLSGDLNPLHSDPSFAAMGGFDRPILHGLCTYGFTGRALLHALCDDDPARFGSMEARFSTPVMPGDTLTVRMWVDGDDLPAIAAQGELVGEGVRRDALTEDRGRRVVVVLGHDHAQRVLGAEALGEAAKLLSAGRLDMRLHGLVGVSRGPREAVGVRRRGGGPVARDRARDLKDRVAEVPGVEVRHRRPPPRSPCGGSS